MNSRLPPKPPERVRPPTPAVAENLYVDMFEPAEFNDVFCYLKASLEPRYRVVAEPDAGYFAQHRYRYRVFDRDTLVGELQGELSDPSGGVRKSRDARCETGLAMDAVVVKAVELVRQLRSLPADATPNATPADAQSVARTDSRLAAENPVPYASRLSPIRAPWTFFSSGRAAFAFLLRDIAATGRVYLPSFVCWSLVDVMQTAFADRELKFYAVDCHLNCQFPDDATSDDVVVCVNYFGQQRDLPVHLPAILLNDCSHQLLPQQTAVARAHVYSFGSLRKMYRVPDGGFVGGDYNVLYAADRHLDAWLRQQSRDWTDLREAENMIDRHWKISDISGRSLTTILQTDAAWVAQRRRTNQQFLADHFVGGAPVLQFGTEDVPLLHDRSFETVQQRDDLKAFLAARGFFASIHWPLHEAVAAQAAVCDVSGARWLQDHTFALPVAEDFDESVLAAVCDAAREFDRAGGSRFVLSEAG